MTKQKRLVARALAALLISAAALAAAPAHARAADQEFDAITHHLVARYNARRVKIPFLGLANFFVKIVRPAGVKSFKVAIFEDLETVHGAAGSELGLVMRNALSPEWQPLARIRSGDEQIHVYAREAGTDIKLMVVTIDHSDAVVARVKISPKKLREFLDNPKVLGISIKR